MGRKEVAAAARKAAEATPEAAAAAIQEATNKAHKALRKRPASSAKGECGAPATTSFPKRPRKQARLQQEKQQPEQQPPQAAGVHHQQDEHGSKKRRRQQQQQHQFPQDRHQTTDMEGKGDGAASNSLDQSEKTETTAAAPLEGSPSAENDAAADAADSAAAIDAAAAADPYLLEDAEYLRRETRWLNRQRVLVLGSRGISARSRHLIEDLKKLLPHHKSETKWEKKEKLQSIAELCQLRSCNSVLYLEQRKNDALLHVAKVPLGPTFIGRLMNVETLSELRLSGNCLLHSRPLLIFGSEFDGDPHYRVLKELFVQVFGTPRNHPKSKPFFDHAMSFFVSDNRIWFRHYQIAPLVVGEGGDANNPHRQTFIEIGPRFVLDPVKILEGSFCGKTLWRNTEFVRTLDLLRPRRLQAAIAFARRQGQKEKRKLYEEAVLKDAPKSKIANEDVFGTGILPSKEKRKLRASKAQDPTS
ncbi:ribosome biogenesis protein brix, putative [Eimeria necatrix]|uniref:Ribosome biogenesis protein brix, putative n=1 Tax=Eimeria necatrix TaxID=51315 RepID=U6MK70_9EIME|nr:ribosome biogenesis protein brix, putative [Eimeria necatrix]CDJ62869.1 ribosome biogenesis protein brix, putative [Eimeria necatrix]